MYQEQTDRSRLYGRQIWRATPFLETEAPTNQLLLTTIEASALLPLGVAESLGLEGLILAAATDALSGVKGQNARLV